MNVINDPWLYVQYLNGDIKQISIRQAFIDADNIKNIETPIFHGTKVYIYDVPVIQLFSIILLSAYFKPENSFIAHNKYFSKKLMENGWDIDLILNYLDKWQNRFNLEDEKYPFLQDIRLKDIESKDNNLGFISQNNLVAPGGNNLIFEHNSNNGIDINQFIPTLDELVYILLYMRTMGSSPMATYYPNKSLCGNTTMFMINYGKTLKETIIYNSLPLRDSDCDDELYDKPIWELDSYEDIKVYDIANLHKNVLLCTFFPCHLIYAKIINNIVKDIVISRNSDDVILDKNTKEMLSLAYVTSNPWGIKQYIQDKKENTSFEKYKEWNKSIKLINLCIDITKKMPSGCGCKLISTDFQDNKNANSVIYYREYDGMKSNVLSFGKYEVKQDILDILLEENNHNKAIQFQDNLAKIQNKFNEFNNSGLTKSVIDTVKLKFSKFAENYFFNDFITNINNEYIIITSIIILVKEAKRLIRELEDITTNPIIYAKCYKKFCGSLNKITREEENYAN